jgi:hypothetical protein
MPKRCEVLGVDNDLATNHPFVTVTAKNRRAMEYVRFYAVSTNSEVPAPDGFTHVGTYYSAGSDFRLFMFVERKRARGRELCGQLAMF